MRLGDEALQAFAEVLRCSSVLASFKLVHDVQLAAHGDRRDRRRAAGGEALLTGLDLAHNALMDEAVLLRSSALRSMLNGCAAAD